MITSTSSNEGEVKEACDFARQSAPLGGSSRYCSEETSKFGNSVKQTEGRQGMLGETAESRCIWGGRDISGKISRT